MHSLAGHKAADWTADPASQIFTCRLRILETDAGGAGDDNSQLSTCVVLEDPTTGQLFAACPYDNPAAVEPVTDSSRFFAVRVADPTGGRKAILGIGFEERSDAFDFAVALGEARRVLGMDPVHQSDSRASGGSSSDGWMGGTQMKEEARRDLSLKEGETITINLGGNFGSRRREQSLSDSQQQLAGENSNANLNSFALMPPPSAVGSSFLPPPPKSKELRAQKRLSRGGGIDKESVKALGFDDGQHDEFA